MKQLLEGIRVLDWTMFHAGAATGYMLGDLGAEVIKIEQPVTGDALRGMASAYGAGMVLPDGRNIGFENANRNKKGISLDLSMDAGREVLYRLVAKSDVFLTNFRRSITNKLRVDYETLCGYNPKIIYCYESAFGKEGPDADRRGFDPLAQARSGLMFNMGDRDQEEPLQMTGMVADQLCATMGAWGVTAALLARELHGFGQEVESSLLGSMIHLQQANVQMALLRDGREMARHSRKRSRNPLSNMYRCADGHWIVLAEPQSDRYWRPFCHALEVDHLADDPRFATSLSRRDKCVELIRILDDQFATQRCDYWMKRLRELGNGIACDVVNKIMDLANDPQVIANQYIFDYEHETLGAMKQVALPIHFSKTPSRINSCAPEFGQHTEHVLLEIAGYSWEDIEQLRAQGAI